MPTSETLVRLLYVYWGRYIVLLEFYLPLYVILVGLSYYIRIICHLNMHMELSSGPGGI